MNRSAELIDFVAFCQLRRQMLELSCLMLSNMLFLSRLVVADKVASVVNLVLVGIFNAAEGRH